MRQSRRISDFRFQISNFKFQIKLLETRNSAKHEKLRNKNCVSNFEKLEIRN